MSFTTDDRATEKLPQMKFSTMHETVQKLDMEFQNPKPLAAPPGEQAWRVDYDCQERYYQFTYRRVRIQREEQEPGQLATAVPVKDVETEANSQAAFRTIFRTVQRYKEQRAIIHFNLAGGRKKHVRLCHVCRSNLIHTPKTSCGILCPSMNL